MSTINDAYGQGIMCPFRRDGKGDFANASGPDLLRSDIGELLGIIGPSATQPGELPWDTQRGTRLIELKHRGLHRELVRSKAQDMAAGTIRRYESRARVGQTTVRTENGNTLVTVVRYTPVGFNQQEDRVEVRSNR